MKNFSQVRPNLYRGSAPNLSDLHKLSEQFNIERIISLDQQSGEKINAVCRALNIEHIIIPLDHNEQSIEELLQYKLSDLINSNIPTFIHCARGKDRTGFFIALVRCLLDHWSARKAIKEAKSLGFGTGIKKDLERIYLNLIVQSEPKNKIDQNFAYDIVTNVQTFNSANRDETLDPSDHSFSGAYADTATRKFPNALVDPYYNAWEQTRENYGLPSPMESRDSNVIPSVGVFDAATQITNTVGPSLVGGGFL